MIVKSISYWKKKLSLSNLIAHLIERTKSLRQQCFVFLFFVPWTFAIQKKNLSINSISSMNNWKDTKIWFFFFFKLLFYTLASSRNYTRHSLCIASIAQNSIISLGSQESRHKIVWGRSNDFNDICIFFFLQSS